MNSIGRYCGGAMPLLYWFVGPSKRQTERKSVRLLWAERREAYLRFAISPLVIIREARTHYLSPPMPLFMALALVIIKKRCTRR